MAKPNSTYDPARYRKERVQRLAYQRIHYQAHLETILPRNNVYYHTHKHDVIPKFADGLPPGPHVWHCNQWQRVTHLPHVCATCRVRLFAEEDMTHD